MKRIGAIIVGLACLSAAAHAIAPYGELDDALLTDVKNGMKVVKASLFSGNVPNAGKPSQALVWVTIPGGQFKLGTSDFDDAKPTGETYTIKTFDVSKTLVTVEQYDECVIKGGCTKPDTGKNCNSYKWGRQLHPVNCVDWVQANKYAEFLNNKPENKDKKVRLLSEAEYEYAARSGGKKQKYPWGNEDATCERAVMSNGCGSGTTMPVCLKPKGNTNIEGLSADKQLCDMVGNVWQWVQDKYQNSYANTPLDGSASEGPGYRDFRGFRGGSFGRMHADYLRADYRNAFDPAARDESRGFRLARVRRD